MKLSVITPSLNPRKEYIRRVFDALGKQTVPLREWEYLVVDSGNTPPLRERFDLSWHPHASIIGAPEQRLAVSRLRGLEQARGNLIVFVDDDNVLAADYLETAMREMEKYSFIGVLGGYVEAEFHGEVQPWMHEFLPILGASQFLPKPVRDICYGCPAGPWVPSGSGMIIRKAVAAEYCRQVAADPSKLTIGRVGGRLLGSDDVDLAYTSFDLDMAIGRSIHPRLTHLIPASRLTEQYLVRLLYASNYSTASMDVRRGWKKKVPLPPLTFIGKMKHFWVANRKTTPKDRCWRAFAKGYRDGLAGAPFDERFL